MIRCAFLGAQFVGQLSLRRPDGFEVAWLGTDAARFEREVPVLKPDVVVLDINHLDDADAAVRRLIEACRAELSIVTYSFARRALLRALQDLQVRVLQSPITLDMLQAHLGPLIVRDLLEAPKKESSPMVANVLTPAAPRYTREQLGRLLEVSSSIECECPNHLAKLVEQLQSFEAYSKDCQSKNDADRAIHTKLYQVSGSARAELEQALADLIVHEKIQL